MTELKLGHFYKISDLLTRELSINNSIVKIIAKMGQNCSIQSTEGRVYTLSTILLAEHLKEARTVSNFTGISNRREESVPSTIPDSQPTPEPEPSTPGPEAEPESVVVEPETSPEEDNTIPQEELAPEKDSDPDLLPEEEPTPEPEVEPTSPEPLPQDNPYGDDPLSDDPYGDSYI